jgi:hypothetical protein
MKAVKKNRQENEQNWDDSRERDGENFSFGGRVGRLWLK